MPIHLPPINFKDCIRIANQYVKEGGIASKKHLMLGNGFSMALSHDIFGYESLADLITTPEIVNLFDKLGTKDFEHVMRRLTDALEVVNINSSNSQPAIQMQSNLDELRTKLIEVISNSHPDNTWDIAEVRYKKCHDFLSYFDGGNKYTFNYDLLLYWVYMHFRAQKLTISDGFGYASDRDRNNSILTWDISRDWEQNVYYIHGAMHLFNDGEDIQKLNWASNGLSLKEQSCNSIGRGKYPMFISEGTKDHKRSRIQNSSYLKHAFDSLDKINDNLFIFGHSLDKSDDHVFDQVNSLPNLKNIFVSIFDGADPADKQIIIDKVTRWAGRNPNKDYYLYGAASADVWGTP